MTTKLAIEFGVYEGFEYSCIAKGKFEATVSATDMDVAKRLATESLTSRMREKLSKPIVTMGEFLMNPDAAVLVVRKIEAVE